MTGEDEAAEYRGLVVADDLTGAADTGREFARRGHPTVVALGTERDADAEYVGDSLVLVVNTESRYSPTADARASVERAVSAYDADVVYKKVDSTLRGNIAAEIEGALAATGADVALVAPAFPANGRTTACGFHLVEGTLVAETPAGRDPDKPVTTSHVPQLLSSVDCPIEHVSVDRVARGPKAVADTLTDVVATVGRPSIVICDAIHDEHLRSLALGGARVDLDIVYVGSAGLAGNVQVTGHLDGTPDSEPVGAGTQRTADRNRADEDASGGAGYVFGVVGSTHPVTLSQFDAVPEHQRVVLDPETAVQDPERAAAAAVDHLQSIVADGSVGVVASAESEGDVAAALTAGDAVGLGESAVRERVAKALSLAATEAWERDLEPAGLFLTGGAVAIEVLTALSASGILLTGDAVESGVPVGSVVGGTADRTPVITKAGGFGGEKTIVNCLARLGGNDD